MGAVRMRVQTAEKNRLKRLFLMEEKVLFQIMARSDGLKLNVLMPNLFLKNIQLFTSEDVNRWTGVVWITRELL